MWTQIWSGLVAGGLTLGGVWLTQRRSDRREALAWDRQRERESEVWAREDAARTYEHRRDAYLNYVKEWRDRYDRSWSVYEGDPGAEFPEDWLDSVYRVYLIVAMFGTSASAAAAWSAFKQLSAFVNSGKRPEDPELSAYMKEVRLDLGIPDRAVAPALVISPEADGPDG